MTKGLLILLLTCWLTAVCGQSSTSWASETYPERPRIGLALSGGGAHGLAHVGVLAYLEEIGIPVDYITGTSMGAIVGGLYAIGYDADRCGTIAHGIDWDDVLASKIALYDVAPIQKSRHNKYPLSISIQNGDLIIPEGIISSTKLDLLLEELLSPAYLRDDFDDLTIPFKCFAVDITKGEVVTLESGKLSKAIRASMAIPSVFDPVEIDGRLLVDGGLIRNFPVTDVREMGADIVIGSYVGSESGDSTTYNGLFDLLKQSAFMMSLADTKEQLAETDILVKPMVKDLPVFAFSEAEKLIEAGYQAAKQNKQAFLALKELLVQYAPAKPKATLLDPGFVFVHKVEVKGLPTIASRIARDKIGVEDRSFTSFENINTGVSAIHATKIFGDVNYTLSPSPDGSILEVDADIKKSINIGATVNHFTSTNSALVLMLESRNQLGLLSELSLQMRLSEKPGLLMQYYKRTIVLRDALLLGLEGKAEEYELPYYSGNRRTKDMELWDLHLAPYVMFEPSNAVSVRASWKARYQYLDNRLASTSDMLGLRAETYSFGLDFQYNTVNKQQFPTSGTHLGFQTDYIYAATSRLTIRGDISTERLPLPTRYFQARLSLRNHTQLLPRLVLSSSLDGRYMSASYLLGNMLLGGSQQESNTRLPFIGMNESQRHMSSYAYARVELRYQVWGRLYGALVSNAVLGNSPITYYLTNENTTNYLSELGVGISLGLDTPVGPIHLDIGTLTGDSSTAAYLGVGYRHVF